MQTQETTDGADRAIPLVAMVTGDELAMIQAGAAMAGVSTGEWMRAAALDATRAPVGGADRQLSVLYAVLFDLDLADPVLDEVDRHQRNAPPPPPDDIVDLPF